MSEDSRQEFAKGSLFHEVMDSIHEGVGVHRDGVFLYANTRLAAMVGLTPETMIGRRIEEFLTRESLPVAAGILQHPARTSRMQMVAKDIAGRPFPCEVQGKPIRFRGSPARLITVLDTSDRQQAEQALQASERRFQAVFEGVTGISIQGYRADGTVVYWNPASEVIYGYTADEALGRNLLDLIIPEPMHAGVRQAIDWMFTHGQGIPAARLELRHQSGRPVHVFSSHSIVEESDGQRTLFCLDIDLAELEQTQRTVRDHERLIEAVVENAGNVIVVLDNQGRIVRFNKSAEAITGYRFEELEGKAIWDYLIPPERKAEVREVFAALMLKKLSDRFVQPQTHENEWVTRDGTRRMLEWRNTVLHDEQGNLAFLVALGYDITERNILQQQMRVYQTELEALVEKRTADLRATHRQLIATQFAMDSAGIGICWVDYETGRMIYTNPHFARMLGYDETEILHLTVPDVDANITPEKFRAGREVIRERLHDQFESRTRSRDGQSVPVEVTVYYQAEDAYTPAHIIGFVRDISARKLAEAALTRAKEDAEAASQAKSQFLANMSHEIRTPLNGVLGLAQIGHRGQASGVQARELFSRILDSGKLLLTIINDILDFSKIEAGKMVIESVPFSPASLAEKVIDSLAVTARTKGIPLICEAAGLPAACLGDPTRISQILLNLLSNAVKFTDHGDVRLVVGYADGQLVAKVSDTGIGIPAEELERLFLPFEQADSSTTRRFGGTGLGLPISRRIAELMGGRLTAASVLGEGSTFTLQLPLPETVSLPAAPAPAAQQGKPRLSGMRLLAAEDSEINQFVLIDFLQREGASVTMVGNGLEAVETAEAATGPFDAVLMDVQMPVMDGLEATRRLRRIAPQVPVIGQTAHALEMEYRRCIAAGMAAVITKPIDIDELVRVVLEQTTRSTPAAPATPAAPPPATVPSPASATAVPPAPPAAAGFPAVSEPVVDWVALEKRFTGRTDFIRRLADITVANHLGDADRLRRLAAERNTVDIEQVAHMLKGLAGNLCAAALEQQARRVVNMARVADPAVFAATLPLADCLEQFIEALKHGKSA